MSELTDYLNSIARYSLLDEVQEINLAKRVCEGDSAAREEFINSNLRLVVFHAKQYWNERNALDLIQAGNLGLIDAVDSFDPSVGTRFSTYASFHIRKQIFRHFRDSKQIMIPYKVKGHDNLRYLVSLSTEIGDESDLESVIGQEPQFPSELESEQLSAYVRSKIATLKPREQEMFSMIWFEEKSFADIADIYGVSKQRIHQIYREAYRKIRKEIIKDRKAGKISLLAYE